MELEEALAKIQELSDKLAKAEEKGDNFDRYRKNHSVSNEELEAITQERDKYKTDYTTLNETVTKETQARRENLLSTKKKEMSKGDEKRLAAIEAEYAVLNIDDTTEEGIIARLEKARSIVDGSQSAPSIMNATGGTSPITNNDKSGTENLSDNAKGVLEIFSKI